MEIAIPSYKRHGVIMNQTLKTLKTGRVPAEWITIFVATDEERELYAGLGYRVVVGVKGLCPQRVFISNHYKPGTRVVSLDDDVLAIQSLIYRPRPGEKKKSIDSDCSVVEVTDLPALFSRAFADAEKHGVKLWGFYPVANKGFMQTTAKVGLNFIMGHCFGFYAGDPIAGAAAPMKDDYYTSLWHFKKYGGTLRYDNICVKSKSHDVGGTNSNLELKLMINNDSCRKIVRDFPGLVEIKKRNCSDPWLSRYSELRLKNIVKARWEAC